MIILQNYTFLMKWLGLEPIRLNKLKNNLNAYCYLFASILNIVTSVGHFYLNMNNLKDATNSIITSAGSLMTFIVILHLLLNSHRFTSLLQDLQDIVNESELEGNSPKFNIFRQSDSSTQSVLITQRLTFFHIPYLLVSAPGHGYS